MSEEKPDKVKPLTKREREFAEALSKGMGSIQAARQFMRWKCEPGTKQYNRAKDLARSLRIKRAITEFKEQEVTQAQAIGIVTQSNNLDLTNLRQFAYDRLCIMRNDPDTPARSRFMAIQALERLNDPSKDINLIYRWVDIMWRYYMGHCPACHSDFPLWQVRNERLAKYREEHSLPLDDTLTNTLDRRLALLSEADKRRTPHPGQIKALAAPERHIVGVGPARAGKSFTLAMFCYLYLLIPGVEIWILARIYDDAEPEFKYLESFLKTTFNPVTNHMVNIEIDSKSGEASITTRWGSILRIKSGKSKGSITGRELEFAGVAEPAWVDAALYEELRARMSSRLGRIVALGTPKGFGGLIHRMVKQANRGPDGKIRKPEDRLISNGCKWGESLLYYVVDPTENPDYVLSEREAARGELTKEEYASEFEGIMMAAEGARFPYIGKANLMNVDRDILQHCVFVLGVDQGPKNFGACLLAYDGKKVYAIWEFFDNSDLTIKANLINLNKEVPGIIAMLGGNPEQWKLTIFDADPPVQGILDEMVEEHRPWKSEQTYRPKNLKDFTNWREETMEWINSMGKDLRYLFDNKNCDLLHDQVTEALIQPKDSTRETSGSNSKGWIVKDMYRGDHVMDAWLLASHCIMMDYLAIPIAGIEPVGAFTAHKMQFDFERLKQEKRELTGENHDREAFKEAYGYEPPRTKEPQLGWVGWYGDEG